MRIIYTQFTRTYTVVESKQGATESLLGVALCYEPTEVVKRLTRGYGAGLW